MPNPIIELPPLDINAAEGFIKNWDEIHRELLLNDSLYRKIHQMFYIDAACLRRNEYEKFMIYYLMVTILQYQKELLNLSK